MTNKKLITMRLWVFVIMLGVSLILGVVLYYNSLLINLQYSTCKTLNEVIQQEKNNFYRRLKEDSTSLEGYGKMFPQFVGDEQSAIAAMDIIMKSTRFEFVFFARTDGESINNNGESSYIGDRDYFRKALSGRTVISEPVKSKIRDVNAIVVATPVRIDGNIIGVLMGSFDTTKLNALFMSSFDGYGYSYIVTNSGDIVAKTDSIYSMATTVNLFESFKYADFFKDDSYETMQNNLLHEMGGHSQYKLLGENRMMHYDKLGINGWNIFTIVNPMGVEAAANRIVKETVLLTLGMLIIFALLVFYNVLSKRKFTKELTRMAFEDQVTGFRSFGKFRIDAQELLNSNTEADYIFIKMDIENFKLINQIYSQETGDKVLKTVAQSLENTLNSKTDAFGRIYADEFVLLISTSTPNEGLEKKLKFQESFTQLCNELIDYEPMLPQGRYKLEPGETDLDKIFEKANFAHHLAKNTHDKVLNFDKTLQEHAIRKREMESHMGQALKNEEFQMFLQPKYSIKDGSMVGAEAVARWMFHDGTLLLPDDFIPLFEQSGFIKKLDIYMFNKACEMLADWIRNGIEPVRLSINFSSLHLHNPNFASELQAIANGYGVPCNLLELELSESAILDNIDQLDLLSAKLHSAGFKLTLDGFGSGYFSLRLLRNISVSTIKIARDFFTDTINPKQSETIIACMLDTAHKLDICVVAEGVETKEHLALLSKLGCEIAQGYYYAAPMPAQEFEVRRIREFLLEK